MGSRSGRWAAVFCGAFAAAAGCGFAAGQRCAPVIPTALAGSGALVIGAALAARPEPGLVAAVLVAVALGTIRAVAALPAPGVARVDGHLGIRPVTVVGTVRQTDRGGYDVVVDVTRVSDSEQETTVSGGVLATGANLPPVAPGDRVEVDASGLRAPGMRIGAESQAVLEREGVQAIATAAQMSVLAPGPLSLPRAIAWVQQRLVDGVRQVTPEPAGALILGIAFGIRQSLAADVRAPLQDAGLIHIVVVSGLKVVMVIGMVAAVARLREWSRRRTLLAALPVVGAYVLLSGSGPAALRSALMAGAAMSAGVAGRRTDPLPMLALVAACMLGVDPALAQDVGFQLSFLGTAGILLLAAPIAARVPGPRIVVEPFAVTIAAQIATVPVMAQSFGVVALGGPIANAIVLPLLPAMIVVGGGGALLSALAPALGWLPLHMAALGASVSVVVARAIAAIPGAAVHVGSWPASWTVAEIAGLLAAGAAALAVMRRSRGGTHARRLRSPTVQSGGATLAAAAVTGVAAAVLALLIAGRPDGRMHVTLLDTGSAPAVLVHAGDGGTALIDGGADPSLLVQALGRVLPPAAHRIDVVVLTGGERAAAAGLTGLPGHYDVGTVIDPGSLTPGGNAVLNDLQQAGADIVEPGGRTWSWGGARWRCLDFEAQATGRSMCAITVADATGRVLVLGDAGTADQGELSAVYGLALRADLVITQPGGALSPLLLNTAQPREVAVPLAKGARVATAVPGLASSRTGLDGDLTFDGGPNGLTPSA